MDQKVINGKSYYLVRRITGWHEKIIVLQVFDQEPKLDRCNQDLVKPVLEDSIDDELPIVDFSIDLKNNLFDIQYGKPGDQEQEPKLRFKSS